MADDGEDWGGEHQVKNYRSFTQGYLNLSCLNRKQRNLLFICPENIMMSFFASYFALV